MQNFKKYCLYFLPTAFIIFATGLIVLKSPLYDIKNRMYEESAKKLHVFKGYDIEGESYDIEMSYILYDNLSTKRLLQNAMASCYGRCLRNKKCVATSTDIKENSRCRIYQTIGKVVKNSQSQLMLRNVSEAEFGNLTD